MIPTCRILTSVSARYLSFNVDAAQVVGGLFWNESGKVDGSAGGNARVPPYDFTRPKLKNLVRELAPAYMRIGGTASDQVFYDLSGKVSSMPPRYDHVLTRQMWDSAAQFAKENGLEIMFTLNAGPGPRDSRGRWDSSNARELMAYSRETGVPVTAWGLGNEPNYLPFAYGMWLTMDQLADNYRKLRTLRDELDPKARMLGPACAFWPVTGELMPVFPSFMQKGGSMLDVVTWHYYPQQSTRSPYASRRASLSLALRPDFLDEVGKWSRFVHRCRDRYVPSAEVWCQETGNAQCGGQPGLSDRFIAGIWWLDQLGLMARMGEKVVVRQNLSGADYSLLDERTLEPNPDYWNSLLWKRLMGSEVLDLEVRPLRPDLRVYAHNTERRPGFVTILALNLSQTETLRLDLEGREVEVYTLSAPDPLGKEVYVNGQRLTPDAEGKVPDIEPVYNGSGCVPLGPVNYAFLILRIQ
ncbi:MAG: hypothetical protein EHM41_05715 [Chloroflexi bacterium]|nr:MAG: hypothetical protein EHM41_05715 [Chloroflexota bacterium]